MHDACKALVDGGTWLTRLLQRRYFFLINFLSVVHGSVPWDTSDTKSHQRVRKRPTVRAAGRAGFSWEEASTQPQHWVGWGGWLGDLGVQVRRARKLVFVAFSVTLVFKRMPESIPSARSGGKHNAELMGQTGRCRQGTRAVSSVLSQTQRMGGAAQRGEGCGCLGSWALTGAVLLLTEQDLNQM